MICYDFGRHVSVLTRCLLSNLSKIQNHRHTYPNLYRVALDVLPVQASAVPCERVFSSSKETDTERRSSLGELKMEQLQLLKFTYRQDRLSFTQDLLYTERELSVLDIEPQVVEDLIRRGELEALDNLIADSWKGWGEVEANQNVSG